MSVGTRYTMKSADGSLRVCRPVSQATFHSQVVQPVHCLFRNDLFKVLVHAEEDGRRSRLRKGWNEEGSMNTQVRQIARKI